MGDYLRERPVPASHSGCASNAAFMIQPPMMGRTQSALIMNTSLDRNSRRSFWLTSSPAMIGLSARQPTVVMEVVGADLCPVNRRHAAAGDDLSGRHIRASILEQERVCGARLSDESECRNGHRQSDETFLHKSPQIAGVLARVRGAQSHPV